MREYRITRPEKYRRTGKPIKMGLADLSVRHGYYILARTPAHARVEARKKFKFTEREPLDVEEQTQDGWRLAVTRDAQTTVTTYDDSSFNRTALVIKSDKCGSIDVLDSEGRRVAQINIFLNPETLIIDTIDVEDMWPERMVVTFRSPTSRDQILKAGTVNSVDFRKPTRNESRSSK